MPLWVVVDATQLTFIYRNLSYLASQFNATVRLFVHIYFNDNAMPCKIDCTAIATMIFAREAT